MTRLRLQQKGLDECVWRVLTECCFQRDKQGPPLSHTATNAYANEMSPDFCSCSSLKDQVETLWTEKLHTNQYSDAKDISVMLEGHKLLCREEQSMLFQSKFWINLFRQLTKK